MALPDPRTSETRKVARKVAVTFAQINATTSANTDITVTGVDVGDVVVVNFDVALDAGFVLVQAPFVSALNTVRITLRNTTAGALTQTALNARIIAL